MWIVSIFCIVGEQARPGFIASKSIPPRRIQPGPRPVCALPPVHASQWFYFRYNLAANRNVLILRGPLRRSLPRHHWNLFLVAQFFKPNCPERFCTH
jgi:hypothetical protein